MALGKSKYYFSDELPKSEFVYITLLLDLLSMNLNTQIDRKIN